MNIPKNYYIIPAIAILAIIAIYLVIAGNKTSNNNNSNTNTTEAQLTNFTAQEIGVSLSYPNNWQTYYNPPTDIFSFSLELRSDIKTNYIDPISNQTIKEPLVDINVYQQPNFENVSLSEWISKTTSVIDEQERIKKDKDGLLGIRQWIWHKSNAYALSSINYYILKDNYFWEFRAIINENNPESTQFKEVVKTVDQIFDSIKFTEPVTTNVNSNTSSTNNS